MVKIAAWLPKTAGGRSPPGGAECSWARIEHSLLICEHRWRIDPAPVSGGVLAARELVAGPHCSPICGTSAEGPHARKEERELNAR